MSLKKRILGIFCMLGTASVLFAGLWPFDLSPKNRAYWLTDGEGLYFDGQRDRWKLSVGGIAYTPSPLSSLKPACSEKGLFTIEILVKPALEVNNGVPHILSLTNDSGKDVFYLGQWKQWFIVRWFSYDQRGKRLMREIGVSDALVKGKTTLLTITSNQESTSIYQDGQLAKRFQGTALIGEKESIRGDSIALGNSRNATSSWTGSILALKLYERELSETEIAQGRKVVTPDNAHEGLIASFAFLETRGGSIPDLSGNQNSITVPELITTTNPVLTWPDRNVQNRASLTKDVIVNVLGFVPFGFLLSIWREQTNRSSRWRSCLFTILVGALISLGIEVAQAFIPARDSSMIDLICNTAGAFLGAGFWVLVTGNKYQRLGSEEA